MNVSEFEVTLTDFFHVPRRAEDSELAIIEAALFVEQTFGIPLSDDQILSEVLGTPDAVRRLVTERVGGR